MRPICYYIPRIDNPLNVASVVLIWAIFFIVSCIVAIMIIYVTKLHITLKTTNMENAKLLDGMHEGLLILSKKERRTMFCNSTADKLLTMYLGGFSELVQETNLKKAIFGSEKLTMRDGNNKDTGKTLLSLEDIIIL